MRARIGKIFACFTLALLLLFATGCETEIDLYEQQDEDGWYFLLEVRLPASAADAINKGASTSRRRGEKWTIDAYVSDYLDVVGEAHGLQARLQGVYRSNAHLLYRYAITVPKTSASEQLTDALTLSGDTDSKSNGFIRTVNVVRDDRFNYWIRQFEDAEERFLAGEHPMDEASVLGILLFGCYDIYPQYAYQPDNPDIANNPEFLYDEESGTVYREKLPPLGTAFPSAQLDDFGEIALNNFWYASKKMTVACDAMYREEDDNRGLYYLFAKTMDEGDTQVEYSYYRADPTGWYLTAIAGGGIAVGLAFLAAHLNKKRKNKQPKPQIKDNFPYDPFSDFFSGGDGNNDNNPFAGY